VHHDSVCVCAARKLASTSLEMLRCFIGGPVTQQQSLSDGDIERTFTLAQSLNGGPQQDTGTNMSSLPLEAAEVFSHRSTLGFFF
jgi:hypothetical protein